MKKRIAKKIMFSDYYWVSIFNEKRDMFIAARSPKHLHLLGKAFAMLGDHEFVPMYKRDYKLFCNCGNFAEELINPSETNNYIMKHYNVVAAVIEHEGKILCMKRGEGKYSYTSLHWEFPGGKIEPGETPEEALHRELLEEMDYDVTVGEHIITVNHEYPDFSITMSAYRCQASTPIFSRKEHADHKWLSLEELSSLDWCAADMPIMNEVVKIAY